SRIIFPIVPLIQRADEREAAVIFLDACSHLNRMLMLFPADRLAIRSAVGGHAQHRLLAEFEAPLQHVDGIAARMLVNLIAERCMRTWSRLPARFGLIGDRLEEASAAIPPAIAQLPNWIYTMRMDLLAHARRLLD